MLTEYYKCEAVDYQKTLGDALALADYLKGLCVDVTELLDQARKNGDNILFEGAQAHCWISTTVLIHL